MATTVAARTMAREHAELPGGTGERFAGWGVMALPFASGHVLAFRRWSASSIGPAYSSVWHRDPAGRWQMWQNIAARNSCPRYFSAALEYTHVTDIEHRWEGPARLAIRIPDVLDWTVEVRSTAATRSMNAVAGILPERAWRSVAMLQLMSVVAGRLLGVGRVGLVGRTPNGHRFRTGPSTIWMVSRSSATLDGHDLGEASPLPEQARLADFWIPQQGIVAHGQAWFDIPREPGT